MEAMSNSSKISNTKILEKNFALTNPAGSFIEII